MSGDDSARIELAWHAIAQAFVVFRGETPRGDADTLSMSQWRLLTLLQEHGTLRAGEISQRLGMLVPSTSRLLRELEERDHLSRRPDPADRRATLVTISAAGDRSLRTIQRARRTALRRLLAHLPQDERAQLVHHLERMAQLAQAAARYGAAHDQPEHRT